MSASYQVFNGYNFMLVLWNCVRSWSELFWMYYLKDNLKEVLAVFSFFYFVNAESFQLFI